MVYDDGILKSASRGVSMGLGVRVQKGEGTGYAYVERLDWDAMKRGDGVANCFRGFCGDGGGNQGRIPSPLGAMPLAR